MLKSLLNGIVGFGVLIGLVGCSAEGITGITNAVKAAAVPVSAPVAIAKDDHGTPVPISYYSEYQQKNRVHVDMIFGPWMDMIQEEIDNIDNTERLVLDVGSLKMKVYLPNNVRESSRIALLQSMKEVLTQKGFRPAKMGENADYGMIILPRQDGSGYSYIGNNAVSGSMTIGSSSRKEKDDTLEKIERVIKTMQLYRDVTVTKKLLNEGGAEYRLKGAPPGGTMYFSLQNGPDYPNSVPVSVEGDLLWRQSEYRMGYLSLPLSISKDGTATIRVRSTQVDWSKPDKTDMGAY